MKKISTLFCLWMLIFNHAKGASASCLGGQCKFDYSIHYKSAKTYCNQTLSFEEVETEHLFFTILKNGKKCKVYETNK
jgi:hypothetical protein